MKLKYKPDFEQARNAWAHYWAGECLKRPLVVAQAPKPDRPAAEIKDRYWNAMQRQWDTQFAQIDAWLDATLFLGEAIPYFGPDLGPDQFAAFFGTDLKFSPNSRQTNWVEPWITDWHKTLPLKLDKTSIAWRTIIEYSQRLAEHAQGRFLVGMIDLHSNADTLSALRGPQNLCMDFFDCPEQIAQAMLDVRRAFRPVYEALYKAGGMSRETGTIGWIPFWCEGRFATIQCDFICLVSPEISRRYILPALEEEAAFLDHCVLHFDGPGALPHLDDILAIKRIDAIQWVSGDGQPPMHTWLDVLKKCQAAGKGLQIYGVTFDDIRILHKELKPNGIVYCPDVKSETEARAIMTWLERNT